MDTSEGPANRKVQLFQLFAVCAFPIHVWSIVIFLREVPALVLRTSVSELIGVFAYTQTFALIESFGLALILLLVSLILPRRWFRDNLVPQGTLAALIITGWAIALQPQGVAIRDWHLLPLTLLLLSSGALIRMLPSVSRRIHAFAQRVTVLVSVYLVLDLTGVVIVAVRNLA